MCPARLQTMRGFFCLLHNLSCSVFLADFVAPALANQLTFFPAFLNGLSRPIRLAVARMPGQAACRGACL